MRKIRPGQFFIDEESNELVLRGSDEWADDEPDKMNWLPTEIIEIRIPATLEFTPIVRSTDPDIPE